MSRWRRPEVLHPALAALLALLVLFPLLGTFGLWQPHEIARADEAMKLAQDGDFGSLYSRQPPLGLWLVAGSVDLFGASELAARLPLALLGLIAAACTYGIGLSLRGHRAGLLAAGVLLASPLFLFQARQLTSDVPLLATQTMAVLGFIGLGWPREGGRRAIVAAHGALLLVGLVLGFFAGGILLGVVVPLAAMALAGVGLGARGEVTGPEAPRELSLITWIVLAATVVALGIACVAWFDVVAAQPGQRGLLGRHIVAAKGYVPLVGGAWLHGPPAKEATADFLIEQVGFGMFPWSALAAWALLLPVMRPASRRDAWGGILLLGWAAFAYALSAFWVREVGFIRYSALPALAVAVGLVLDDILAARRGERAALEVPLAALFTLAAGIQISRDIMKTPEKLVGVHLPGVVEAPTGAGYIPVVVAAGLMFTALVTTALLLPSAPTAPPARAHRWERALDRARAATPRALPGALGVAVVLALFWSWMFTPSLSRHFSYKNVFQAAAAHRDSEPLGVMGIAGSGPAYYSGGKHDTLAGRSQLMQFLEQPSRVLAIAPSTELCAIQQEAAAGGFAYHVLDAENSLFFLFTNQLRPGETEHNPLERVILESPPQGIRTPLSVSFDNTLELIGVTMPERVKRGKKFEMSLYFKVLRRPTTDYKVFVHFDGKGVRFQADHDPILGRCGTHYWQPGTYVVDTFEVTAGSIGSPRTTYDVWTGFFTGTAGNWKNVPVVGSELADKGNRVSIGKLKVR